MGIFNGFAGKDAQKGDARDLLPYPATAKGEDKEIPPFSKSTATLIAKLIRDGQITGIPASVFRSLPQISNII
jgi:hypothetical protein